MDDPRTVITELQATLENMRSALTSGDLAHLLAAQARCATTLSTPTTMQPSGEFRFALRASLERARATLAECLATNAALLGIVEGARLAADGPLDYTRSGALTDRPASEREASVSCRV